MCSSDLFLQNEGRDGRAVQDVEPDRLLNRFPTTLRVEDDPNEKPEDRYYNLAQYDLIITFDADWSEFQPEQLALLQKWVDTQAGGLILIGGPVNTYQLARDDGSGRRLRRRPRLSHRTARRRGVLAHANHPTRCGLVLAGSEGTGARSARGGVYGKGRRARHVDHHHRKYDRGAGVVQARREIAGVYDNRSRCQMAFVRLAWFSV